MKRLAGIFAFALLLVLPASVFADFNEEEWPFLKEIDLPEGIDSEHAYFDIDGEIYDGTAGVIFSLRISDADGREIPYRVVTKQSGGKREEFSPKIWNNSYLDGQYNSFVLDFIEDRPEINRLTLETGNANFTRRVSVEGSDDMTEWKTLVDDAHIFDFSHNIRSRHLDIEFPLSNFKYLRVKVHDDGSGPIEIDDAKAYRVKFEPAETQQWPLTMIEKIEKGRTTEILFDGKFAGLPINTLDLEVSSRNYHRQVKVASSFDRDKWKTLGSDVIFNYDMAAFKKSDNRISFRKNSDRFFLLTIENYDDQPIDVTGATATGLVGRVIVSMTGRPPYKAYFGAPKSTAPRYDLAHRIRYIQTRALPRLSLRPRMANPSYIKPVAPKPVEPVVAVEPWTERHPVVLWVVMVAVMAALALLIYNLIRKTPPGKPQE